MGFQLIDMERSFIDGNAKYCAESGGLLNGNLVWIDSAGDVRKTGAGSAPHIHGFAYSRRTNVYRPTSLTIPDNEKMNVIRGAGQVRVDTTHFVEGTLPAINARIFGGAGGLMTTTAGSNQAIGRCVPPLDPVNNYIGLGTFTNEAVIEFFFTPLT